MKRYGGLILSSVFFLGGAATALLWKNTQHPEPVHAEAGKTEEAARGDASQTGAEGSFAPSASHSRFSRSRLVVAAGRVEPVSEELKIGSELDGRLKTVNVEEGQHVARGQVIAELVNNDYQARVDLAKAAIAQRDAALDRLRNGSRVEQRREAAANVREAEAVLAHADLERERRRALLNKGAISRMEFDTTDHDSNVAKARLEAARERLALIQDETRPEDLRRAEADLESAKAQLAEAQAALDKTFVRAPVSGVILRKTLKAGESVSGKGEPAIVTMGDTSRLRIRVDVDEDDVARIRVGQNAWVTADAYGERKFTGKVVRIGETLGRKNITTDEPREKKDTKILETLVELDAGQTLPVGLRVDAFIQPDEEQTSASQVNINQANAAKGGRP
jgi:HlyD family secretion protein